MENKKCYILLFLVLILLFDKYKIHIYKLRDTITKTEYKTNVEKAESARNAKNQ